jgi:glycerophosphoryl diester phosphodiesterase
MRRWLLLAVLALAGIAAAAIGVAALVARPAPEHPFFAGEKPGVQVIAHRGGALLRPENTLEAFAHAAGIGADILEMDLRATADGAIVCIHDATVDRTTDGQGPVSSFTLAGLRKLDAGYRWSGDGGRTFPFRGKGIRVPALEEVFARFSAMRMVLEIKRPPGVALAEPLCSLVRRARMADRVLVASMDEEALEAFRRACPEVATSMGPREARFFAGASAARLSSLYTPPAVALQIPYRLGEQVVATEDLVLSARARNVKVDVWTVNEEERMRELVRNGVHGIITDRPDLLRRMRGSGAR